MTDDLEPQAQELLRLLAERLRVGRKAYGDLRVDLSTKNLPLEALAELLDAVAYLAMELMRIEHTTLSGPAHQSTESVNRTEPLGDAEKAQRSDAGGAPEPGAQSFDVFAAVNELDSAAARMRSLTSDLRHETSGAPLVWWCPQCGPCRGSPLGIDEDGCCAYCGSTCGEIPDPDWYDELLARAYECIEQMAPVGVRTDAVKYDIRRALRRVPRWAKPGLTKR